MLEARLSNGFHSKIRSESSRYVAHTIEVGITGNYLNCFGPTNLCSRPHNCDWPGCIKAFNQRSHLVWKTTIYHFLISSLPFVVSFLSGNTPEHTVSLMITTVVAILICASVLAKNLTNVNSVLRSSVIQPLVLVTGKKPMGNLGQISVQSAIQSAPIPLVVITIIPHSAT